VALQRFRDNAALNIIVSNNRKIVSFVLRTMASITCHAITAFAELLENDAKTKIE